MAEPSWRQLAAIPESLEKDAILRALGIEVPEVGVSHQWSDRGLSIRFHCNPQGESWFVLYDAQHPDPRQRDSPRICRTAADVAKAINWPAGTPTGDAIRRWLTHFGYTPPGKKAPAPTTSERLNNA